VVWLDRTETPHGLGELASMQELRELMWSACGIRRSGPELEAALSAMDHMGDLSGGSRALQLARATARLVVEAALYRQESRGAHHRSDFPSSTDPWRASRAVRSLERSRP
jgi:L-aspartate oxidase